MIAWPLASDPTGSDKNKWLDCDGRRVDASKYPKLANLMNSVPDYRGLFLRGQGSQYSNHFGVILHQSAHLGELQGDTIRNITGQNGSYGSGTFQRQEISSGVYTNSYAGTHYGSSGTSSSRNLIYDFNAANVVPTSNENRPVNKAVRYLIRAA